MNGVTATTPGQITDPWTIRALFARHKLVAIVTLLIVVVLVAMFVVALVSSSAGAVTDSTTCDQWSSASQSQQAAYANLYLHEHPELLGKVAPAKVISAINGGCENSFGDDSSDSDTVVQAVNGDY